MIGGHSSGGLGGQLVELSGGDAFVDTGADFLGDEDRVAVVNAEAIAKLLETRGDLVEVDSLLPPVTLHNVHLPSLSEEFYRTVGGRVCV